MATQIVNSEIENVENDNMNKIEEYNMSLDDINKYKKCIGYLLMDYIDINTLTEIILYDTETFSRFYNYYPDRFNDDCVGCQHKLDTIGYLEHKPCDELCPLFPSIKRGFEKFESSDRVPGFFIYSKLDEDINGNIV